jgi:CheY-like chemotaxis protein
LLIEDNRDAARTLQVVLELFGHTVGLAHTGLEGVEAARRVQPEVILCDLGLPGLDGLAVAQALLREPLTQKPYLIAVSG